MPNLRSTRFWLSLSLLFLFPCLSSSSSKDEPQVVEWPTGGKPILRFSFGKFKSLGSVEKEQTYVVDTSAENLTNQTIPSGSFNVYVFDKNKVRIGECSITIDNVHPAETVRFQTTIVAAGKPVSLTVASNDAHKSITLTVNSVPQGANLSVDGKAVGSTPKAVTVGIGKHLLAFSLEGFRSGTFPLEIGANDTSGGSVSYELGASALDTVELRDGTVFTGDLVAVTNTEVVFRAGGTSQHLDRNKVKRILLTERVNQ